MKKEFIGIDVSKQTLDVWLYHTSAHFSVKNNHSGFISMCKQIVTLSDVEPTEWFVCFENTGRYSQNLCLFLSDRLISFAMESALRIKRSLGLVRGKNDKADAKSIARFAWLHRDELKEYELPSETISELKALSSQRAKLVAQRAGHKAYIKELKEVNVTGTSQILVKSTMDIITVLSEQIAMLEKHIQELIQSESGIQETFTNITSIIGVGSVLGTTMIVMTNDFKNFQNWRQFACYAGIAPFENQSGTSYRGQTKVSSLGHRAIKTLLNQAALSAILADPELKAYYHRRIKEGKSKMSTINIIRNKLLSRIFAVAKRQTPYVKMQKYAA